MSLLQTYLQPWKKYATFQGRANRREYLVFNLANIVLSLLLIAWDPTLLVVPLFVEPFHAPLASWAASFFFLASGLFFLASIVPSVALMVRRLHDKGRSGWMALIYLIPFVGWLIVLILCLQKGDPEANAYGEPPGAEGLDTPTSALTPPNMSLLQTYLHPWKKYATFQGRASRREYLVFSLVNLVLCLLLLIWGLFSLYATLTTGSFDAQLASILLVLTGISFLLAVIVPSVALTVRRLHDKGRNGWMALIHLIPWIGWLILLILCLQKGDPEANAYGEPPQETSR